MGTINIDEAKAHLSRYLKRVEAGETIVLMRHGKPVAELHPVLKVRSDPRPFGLCAGEFEVPEDFNAPLPEELLAAFEGR